MKRGDTQSDSPQFSSDSDTEDIVPPSASKRVLKSNEPAQDQFSDWDNGEPLTEEQRKYVMGLKSNYEKSRAMNKIRNSCMLRELDVQEDVRALSGVKGGSSKDMVEIAKPTAKGKAATKAKHASTVFEKRVTRR